LTPGFDDGPTRALVRLIGDAKDDLIAWCLFEAFVESTEI